MYFIAIIVIVLFALLYNYLEMLHEWYRKVKVIPIKSTLNNHHQSSTKHFLPQVFTQAPGPMPWPIIGNLALLAQYAVPFQGFTELAKRFGDVYCLTLGSTRTLIVNNLDLIREVLNQNGKFFGGRPDFVRYSVLFGGDRSNSLALCDWSQMQQKRRNLARKHCSPRNVSSFYGKMSDVGNFEMQEFMDHLGKLITPGKDFYLKPVIMETCCNMFLHYMCTKRFEYDDSNFRKIVSNFDEIFWEINQGYALDFLPWLKPFYFKHLKKLGGWSSDVRNFILERIINERERNIAQDDTEKDFTDALLKSLADDPTVNRSTILFMLEDFIGGSSAVGNLVMLALGYIARYPDIGKRIQSEVDEITENGSRKLTLYDTDNMPYTIATLFEILRYSSSPIVPHVATEDVCIGGYGVTKGTMVIINNYVLNTNEMFWDKPEEFNPERFLEEISAPKTKLDRKISESSDSGIDDGNKTTLSAESVEAKKCFRVKKNIPHFLPFSIGKRTCIGQNLVRSFSFIMLATLLQRYDVSSNDLSQIKTHTACVALPVETYPISLTPRSK